MDTYTPQLSCLVATHTLGSPHYWLPETLDNPFRFVITEQGTWYDPALNSYLKWLELGYRILDLGNDPGIYAIPAAQRVGLSGRVESLRFSPEAHHALSHATESVHWLSSREANFDSHATYNDVDVIRLGAAALDASGGWLTRHSEILEHRPWLYLSPRYNESWNPVHIERLVRLGYKIGRYIPFIDALVPYDWSFLTVNEPYCVGLFAVPLERIPNWIQQGRWAEPMPLERVPSSDAIAHQLNSWMPAYRPAFEEHIVSVYPDHDLEMLALGLSVQALDTQSQAPAGHRLSDWQWAIQLYSLLIEKQPTVSRLLTLARLRFAAGERAKALLNLEMAHAYFESHNTVLSALFLPPDPYWDNTKPEEDIATWLYAAVMDTWVKQRHLSAYTLDEEGEAVWRYLADQESLPESSQHAWALHEQRKKSHQPN